MTTVKKVCVLSIPLALVLTFATSAGAATVWTGPVVEFSKSGADDAMDPAYQDQLTSTVALTRGSNQGLDNILQDDSFQRFDRVSPEGTMWAFEGLNGNPDDGISAADYESLVFADFTSALGIQQIGRNILDRPGVVHLVEDDIYFDIIITEWGTATEGAAITYQRTSPSVVPVPGAAWLLGSALGLLAFARRR